MTDMQQKSEAEQRLTSRYRDLKSMLDDRRRQIQTDIQARMRNVRADGAWGTLNEVLDEAESSQADTQGDIELALLQMKSEMLTQIDAALIRLDEGDYGNCTECGAEISAKRLLALPFALRCKHCEEARELAGRRERQNVALRRSSLFIDV